MEQLKEMAVPTKSENEMWCENGPKCEGLLSKLRRGRCRGIWCKRGFGSATAVSKAGRRRGVASIEAILGMTVLVLLWAGAKHVALAHVVSLQAKAEARECAWVIASGACRDVPAHCESREQEGESPEAIDELEEANERTRASGGESDAASDMVEADIKGVFKRRISARSSRAVPPSPLLYESSKQAERRYSLPCNTRPMDPYTQLEKLNTKLTDSFR